MSREQRRQVSCNISVRSSFAEADKGNWRIYSAAGMQQQSQPEPVDWPVLAWSIVLFVIHAVVVFVVLGAAMDELARSGALAGQSFLVRLIPSAALGAALIGGALAYRTMGLAPPERVRRYQSASAALAVVALMLLVAKAFGPLLGFV